MACGEAVASATALGGMISPQQHRKVMKQYQQNKNVSRAAAYAGVDRRTARKYIQGAPGPLEPRPSRSWRTHTDAFAAVWPEMAAALALEPQLQAKALFAELQRRYPGQFGPGQQRSFERRVRQWKLEHGSEPPVLFCQEHRPGERLQLDWWDAAELAVTIAGEPYAHKLVAVVLPYSNWQWAQPCRSESFLSLKAGLQAAVWELGAVPAICQTDQSSTATHPRGKGRHGREYNERYLSLLAHYGMQPAVIPPRTPEHNGDVESAHRHLKEALQQGLALRGSRDFARLSEYEEWLEAVLRERNAGRLDRLSEERARMQPLPPMRLPEYEELVGQVSRESLVRVGRQAYSVPARYIGQRVRVRAEELWLSFYCAAECIARVERQPGSSQGVYINWRHILPQLRRRPGAMLRWRHRGCLFPSALWRATYDGLVAALGERRAERDYLGLLALAMDHGQETLEALLKTAAAPATLETVRARLGLLQEPLQQKVITVDFRAELSPYDGLSSTQLQAASAAGEEVAHGC